MMHYKTHVFLGPSLDKATAQQYLGQAHYHPPIQCGDIIRLLRCSPKRIVIIDGLYEQVPAVWHKEIMLALDKGIEVYGAASMGALRAAELHHYGMIGIGKIFHAFATNQLVDDDEVAVLHQDVKQNSIALNDAMVNIRETLAHALEAQIINKITHDALIQWCKAQFYPKRSLSKAIKNLGEEYKEQCARLRGWLDTYGMIDLKRHDAIAALSHVQQLLDKNEPLTNRQEFVMPYTKFIASMVDEVVDTPFALAQPWFPPMEQKLAALEKEKPKDYQRIVELARLLHYSMTVVELDKPLEHHHYLDYIASHKLYYPNTLYDFLQRHDYLAPLYTWMLHYTCLSNVSEQQISRYLPAALFYFKEEVPEELTTISPLCSWIVLLIFLLHHQLNDRRLMIKKSVLNEHLQEIHFWPRYQKYQKQCAADNQPNHLHDVKTVLDFVIVYMKVIYIHHGTKDFKLGLAESPSYYHWVYDAMMLYDAVYTKEPIGNEV